MTKHTILIVEDVPDTLTLFVRMLGDHYNLITAASGREARAAPPPDLVILDYNLPDENGEALAGYFRGERTPFIFLTADGSGETGNRLKKAGALAFLVKPVNRETLLRTVETSLARAADINHLLSANERARRRQWVFAAAGLLLANGFDSIDDAMHAIELRARGNNDTAYNVAHSIIAAYNHFKSFLPN